MCTRGVPRTGGYVEVAAVAVEGAAVREIMARNPWMVGFSSTFQANCSSLAIIHELKKQHPDVATVMGGPASYTDEALRRIHEPFGITRSEFNEVTEILRETLEDFEVESSDINAVMGEFHRREPFIVTRPD